MWGDSESASKNTSDTNTILVSRCDRAAPPRFAWRAPRRAAASRQQGLTTLGDTILKIRLRKERFLILPLACDLVLANEKRAVYVTKRKNFHVQFTVTKGQSTDIQFLSRSIVELRRFFLEAFSSYFAS